MVSRLKRLCGILGAVALVLACVDTGLGQEKESRGAKGAKSKTEAADEASDAKDDAKESKKADKEKADKDSQEKEGESAFGGARKKTASRSSAKPSTKNNSKGGLSKAERAQERFKENLERELKKRLKKDDGYYVVAVKEVRFERAEDVNPQAAAQNRYWPRSETEVLVLDGRDKTLEYLVGYMSEYPPPAPTRNSRTARSKSKSTEPESAPDPQRSYSIEGWSKDKNEAFDLQQRLVAAIEQQKNRGQ
jgi:hypothetical protein